MKETRLGDFEEVILLLAGILEEDAYAFKIAEEFKLETGRSVSIGAVHSALSRLSDKGFLTSSMGEPSAKRGGRRRRIYQITGSGQVVLRAARDLRVNLWNRYPGFSLKF